VAEAVEAVVVVDDWASTAVAIAANTIVNCRIIVAIDMVPLMLPLIPSQTEAQKILTSVFLRQLCSTPEM
jgi:hypothetical protein